MDNSNNNNNFVIILGVFIVASAIRIALNNNQYIVNIIGAVNIIAFWYVWYLILEYSENKFEHHLNGNTFIGEQIKLKKKKHFRNYIKISKLIVFLTGLIYIFFLANSILNDIISLGALFLSIETDYVHNFIQNYFIKKK